jgi:hypothetical protein
LTRIKRDRDTQKELNMEYIIQVNASKDPSFSYFLKSLNLIDDTFTVVKSKDNASIFNYKKAVEVCLLINNYKKAIDYAVMIEFK